MADKQAIPMRKFDISKTIKQIQAKGFEKVGDSYEGTLVGIKQASLTDPDGKQREASLIILDSDSGERFGVWGNAVLEDMITQVAHGTYIRIRHTGVGKAKGRKQGAKLFEIDVAA